MSNNDRHTPLCSLDFRVIKQIMQFYVTDINPDFDVKKNFTNEQIKCYWLPINR